MIISKRFLKYPDNPIGGLSHYANELTKNGVRVISLNIGAPDNKIPGSIINEFGNLFSYLKKTKRLPYSAPLGDKKLIKARASYYNNCLGFKHISDENIVITQGGSEAIELILFAICNPGDEVLTPDPYYCNYQSIAQSTDINISPIPTRFEDGYHIFRNNEPEEIATKRIERQITSKTKAILWSSPCNPTGTVYSLSELKILAKIAVKHNLWLISDEVYRTFVYSNQSSKSTIPRAVSLIDILNLKSYKHAAVIDSSSKEIGLCGARIGYIVSNPEFVSMFSKLALKRVCPNTISQYIAQNVDKIPNKYFENNVKIYKRRRDYIFKELQSLEYLDVKIPSKPPEGAFYFIVDLGKKINSFQYCKWLLTDYPYLVHKKKTIYLTPMHLNESGFYLDKNRGNHEVRLAYTVSDKDIKDAIRIFEDSLKLYLKSTDKK
jgi:aspartate aminotransferase